MTDEAKYFDLDIKAMHVSHHIVREWNRRNMIDKLVMVNVPEVWTFTRSIDSPLAGKMVLQEPYIDGIGGYSKFNSNTGWADNSTSWARAMQALSHFSYHFSAGELLLCDLQGGVYDDAIVLTSMTVA